MLVCHCKRVTDRSIRCAVREGARCADDVASHCGAGGGCGGCRPLVEHIVEEERRAANGPGAGSLALLEPVRGT